MIGFDIGGTKCAVSVGYEVDGALHIEKKEVIPTDLTAAPYVMIERMCTIAERLTDDMSLIGISCGGPLNSRQGIILSPPNLPGWDNVEIVDFLKKRYHGKVGLQNDANACALAEWKYGAGKGTENMIFLTFGSGLGAGLILNGNLYTGASDMAGEVGHIRLTDYGPIGYGKAGSLEGFCSGNGLAQLGRMYAQEQFQIGKRVSFCSDIDHLSGITAKSIAEAADQGNEDALLVYQICGEQLGKGLSILIDILNPELIVIGSIFQRSEHLLKTAMQKVIKKESLPHSESVCQIVPALLKENLGDYAALSIAATLQ
ncbi:MAG: ROK family protein [Clostridia bacterium]|nr:ROK family protein [Clostridia bacterium]